MFKPIFYSQYTFHNLKGEAMDIHEKELILSSMMVRCEVLTMENQLLFMGKITDFDEEKETIQLEDYKDDLIPIYASDFSNKLKIHVNTSSNSKSLILFEGTAIKSLTSHILVHIDNIISKEEGRGNFRQTVMLKSAISLFGSYEEKPCVILDISVKGIGIQSSENYPEDTILKLSNKPLRTKGPLHNLKFKIVRKIYSENENCYSYGCKFIDMSEAEENSLFSDIFALQGEQLRSRRK